MNLQILLYILLAFVLVLIYGFLFLLYKLAQIKRPVTSDQEYTQSLTFIEDAQKQANSIVEKAVESAKHILFETEYLKQDITKEMQDSLSKVAEETIKMVQGRSAESEKEFRVVVDEIKQEFAKEATEKLAGMQKIAIDETTDFKEMLMRETVGSQVFIGNKIYEDFGMVKDQIEAYRQDQMKEVEKQINGIIKKVIEDVMGASITLPIHEDLVLKSLENAKKTGFFKPLETVVSSK